MIEQFDLFFGRNLHSEFDNVLDDVSDVHFVPPELATSRRTDRKDGSLELPFISVYRPPFSPNKEVYNSTLATKGITIPAPNNDTGFKMFGLGFETTYTIDYWDDLQNRANDYNQQWIQLAQSQQKIEFQVPIEAGDVDDTFPFGYTMQLGELTDNSDIARQHDHGADIRYTGDIKIEGLIYQFEPGANDAGIPRIEEVITNYYIQEYSNDELVQSMIYD
jgi:hypothetical protein